MKSVRIYFLLLVICLSCNAPNSDDTTIDSAEKNQVAEAKQLIKENKLDQALIALEKAMISGSYNAMDAVSDADFSAFIDSPKHRSVLKSMIQTHASGSKAMMYNETEPGTKIVIKGTVRDKKDSSLLSGASIELVQADAHGSYFYEEGKWNPRLFGFLTTDENGEFEVETVQPGRYTDGGVELASHIHFNLSKPNYTLLSGEFTFNDDLVILSKGNYNNAPIAVKNEDNGAYHLLLEIEEGAH